MGSRLLQKKGKKMKLKDLILIQELMFWLMNKDDKDLTLRSVFDGKEFRIIEEKAHKKI